MTPEPTLSPALRFAIRLFTAACPCSSLPFASAVSFYRKGRGMLYKNGAGKGTITTFGIGRLAAAGLVRSPPPLTCLNRQLCPMRMATLPPPALCGT